MYLTFFGLDVIRRPNNDLTYLCINSNFCIVSSVFFSFIPVCYIIEMFDSIAAENSMIKQTLLLSLFSKV